MDAARGNTPVLRSTGATTSAVVFVDVAMAATNTVSTVDASPSWSDGTLAMASRTLWSNDFACSGAKATLLWGPDWLRSR